MFEVDAKGLAALLKRRGPDWGAALVLELVQNACDQKVTRVDVVVRPVPGLPEVEIAVEDDDPDGFADLRDAYTLFRPSTKGANPCARGRFNIGEKLVIAVCRRAEIVTTTGGVRFDGGERTCLTARRERGSCFRGVLRMTREEHATMLETLGRVVPPDGVTFTVNGVARPPRPRVACFTVTLPTEVTDQEGVLRRRARATEVHVYEPLDGESPTLYELGLPVVTLEGDRWCLDVRQRVPVAWERNNVEASYLAALRVAVANALAEQLRPEDATAPWVRDALAHPHVETDAVRRAVTLRFGPDAVAYDPSDPEANQRAQAEGRSLVYSGHLSGAEWQNVREKAPELLMPAGRVFPTPKPYAPEGPPQTVIPQSEWTWGMRAVADYAFRLHARLLDGRVCTVRFVRDPDWRFSATYGRDGETGHLCLNAGVLPPSWFDALLHDRRIPEAVDALLLHEFAHAFESNHLSAKYHRALCALGAALKRTGDIESDIVAKFCLPA